MNKKNSLESNSQISISNIANHLTGVSRYVFCVLSECKKCGALNSPKKSTVRKRILEDIDDFDRSIFLINVSVIRLY